MVQTAEPRWFEDGREVAFDPRRWSVRLAEFLGCGFRVVVPDCAPALRDDAVSFVQDQVREIADLLGARVDDSPFDAARASNGAVILEGGWEPVFRGPLGAQLTRVESPVPQPLPQSFRTRVAPFQLLPWHAPVGSPLARLPISSVQADGVALRHLASLGPDDAVGLWGAPDGTVVACTSGSVLHRGVNGNWSHPVPGPGTVPTWLGERVQSVLGSEPRALSPDSDPAGWAALDAQGNVSAANATVAELVSAAVRRARHSL